MYKAQHLYISPAAEKHHFLGFSKDLEEAVFIIMGAPLDISASYRGGSAEAPRAVREASKSLELCTFFTNIDIESVGFHDLGDVVLAPGDIIESMNRIEQVVYAVLTKERRLFILGGEHTITLPSFKAFAKKFKEPCLVVFDAHGDLRQEYLGSRYNHATVLRRIIDEVPHRKVVLMGARALSREEVSYVKTANDSKLKVVQVLSKVSRETKDGLSKAIEECREAPKYVSIDMDFLDPAYAPGVQTPEPLGVMPLELLELLNQVIDENVYVVDIVEITPRYDPTEATAFLGAKIIIEVAGMMLKSMNVKVSCW
jgi:agmatinase